MRSTYSRVLTLAILCLGIAGGCSSSSDFPDPYVGYTHSQPEHGYWREVAAEGRKPNDPALIGEFHLHDRGFSVTYQPFETYKDYWGTYEWNQSVGAIALRLSDGNVKPADFDGVGKARFLDEQTLELSEVTLAGGVASKTYRFERFDPRR